MNFCDNLISLNIIFSIRDGFSLIDILSARAILEAYDIFDHQSALSILLEKPEFPDVLDLLGSIAIDRREIIRGGGAKTGIVANLERPLRLKGWSEKSFSLHGQGSATHKIDCCKQRVAMEIEWNNKDTFFDRDLSSFRLLHEHKIIDCAIILTRSSALQTVFRSMVSCDGLSKDKYVSTTTHLDRLVARLERGGAGSCPVLAIGITPDHITRRTYPMDEFLDWE